LDLTSIIEDEGKKEKGFFRFPPVRESAKFKILVVMMIVLLIVLVAFLAYYRAE